MILFFEIPVIIVVIAAMLLGSVQIGDIFRTAGIVSLVIAVVVLVASYYAKRDKTKKGRRAFAILIGGQGVFLLLFGICFADYSLFEFLFGTDWF